MVQFYDTLRVELPPDIAVTIAMPGFIKSELTTSPSATVRHGCPASLSPCGMHLLQYRFARNARLEKISSYGRTCPVLGVCLYSYVYPVGCTPLQSHIPWYWPLLGTEAAAYHLVDAAERRQHYAFVPLWYTTWLPYRIFTPEIMDWSQRVLLLGRAPSAAVQELLAAAVGEEATEKLFSSMSSLPAPTGH